MFAVLSDYLDRELPPDMCEKLESHLAGCKPCVGYLASLEETVRRLKRHGTQAPNPKVVAEVREKLVRVLQAASVS